jgi:G2/mitotic-specific cyclin 3/4
MASGMNKMPAKRAAFGDVSNTAQANRPAKEDLIVGAKGTVVEVKEQKASAALLRPAQRPLANNTNTAKTNMGANVSSATVATLQKLLPESTTQTTSLANIRKSLAKKSNTIFRDSTTASHQAYDEVSKPAAPLPSIHRQQSFTSNNSDNKPVQRQIRKVQSSYSFLPSPKPTKDEDSRISDELASALTEDGTKPSQPQLPEQLAEEDHQYTYESDAQLASLIARVETSGSGAEALYLPQEDYRSMPPGIPEPQATEVESKLALATVDEPQEYWDDQEDEENYEEEGYVTARSFRSRGEDLTGNATQTLVPRTTNKSRKEFEAAKILVESTKTQEDIEDEAWDTTMVAEYGEEIFDYMHDLEKRLAPNPHYMDLQTEIQWSMRAVLMDWLVQVHLRFSLLPETLFLCVNYIDRFLSYKVVSLGKLQLVGATAIFVAAKYEEINCPSVNEIVYMVDGGYTVDEILKAERFMLSMLRFELGWPGPMSFLRRISKADDYDLETRTVAKYFLEITIMDERFIPCPPSFTAASAHCLARLMLQKGNWTPHHVYYSGYTYSQLYPILDLMWQCCQDPTKHHAAIYEKYLDKRYKSASRFVLNEMRRGFQVPEVARSDAQTFMGFYDHQPAPWTDNRHFYS